MLELPSVIAVSIEESGYFEDARQLSHLEAKSVKSAVYSDEEIVAGLRERSTPAIQYIYNNYYRIIKRMVTSNSGSTMDAEDVFQDAMIIIYQKISTGSLKLTGSFIAFLYSICRHNWLQKLDKKGIHCQFRDNLEYEHLEDNYDIDRLNEDNEKYKLFQEHFLKLKEDDQKVLRLFLTKISLSEIASIMGYKSYKYAKVRKYICKERLKNSILNDPRCREILQISGTEQAF
jgi:RNA polymerase sigma factor (sigma-70 family)